MDITNTNPKPHGRNRWLIIGGPIVVIGIAGALALPSILHRFAAKPITATATKAQPAMDVEAGKVGDLVVTQEAMQLAEIKMGPVVVRKVSDKLAVGGSIEAGGDQVVKITPRVTGKITALYAVAGDTVRAGQTLAMIESPELARAQAALRQATSRLAAAKQNLDRQKKLASLGAFGQPKVQDARRASVTSQGEERTAENEVAGAKAQISESESELRSLQATLSQAQTQVKVTQSRFARAELLLKEQLIARQEWEQAQADVEKAQADVASARARIEQGEAKIRTTQALLKTAEAKYDSSRKRQEIEAQALRREEAFYKGQFTTTKEIVDAETAVTQAQLERDAAIQGVHLLGGTPDGGSVVALTTPLSGRVHERNASLGETVDTEHALFTVMNLDSVWAQLAVTPRDLPLIHLGQTVQLTSETAPGRVFSGTISSVGTTADEATRSIRVRTAVANAAGLLRPGAFVRANIVTDVRRNRITVPESAIQDHTGKKTVYMQKGKPGQFEVRHVKLGAQIDGWREITDGLYGGESVAVSGTFYLKSEAMKSALSDGCCAVGAK